MERANGYGQILTLRIDDLLFSRGDIGENKECSE